MIRTMYCSSFGTILTVMVSAWLPLPCRRTARDHAPQRELCRCCGAWRRRIGDAFALPLARLPPSRRPGDAVQGSGSPWECVVDGGRATTPPVAAVHVALSLIRISPRTVGYRAPCITEAGPRWPCTHVNRAEQGLSISVPFLHFRGTERSMGGGAC